MLISMEFFNQLSPSYKKHIKELDDQLAKFQFEPSDAERIMQQKLIEKFSSIYLMPKEYWQLYETLFDDELIHLEEISIPKKRQWKAYQQFYYDKSFSVLHNPENGNSFYPKLLEFSGGDSQFSYPHSSLNQCFQYYESRASKPPSKAFVLQYKKMKQLYQKIKASQEILEEWFQNLLETGDNEFMVHNVEYRLSENLLDIKLWKLYLNFLETSDTNRMLEVYSKYCRFFLDDSEMKEKYKTKVEKYGPSFVYWNNAFEFETRAAKVEHSAFELPHLFDDLGEDETPVPLSIDITKNFYKSYQSQSFPFQKPFIEYILMNANSAVWRMLHQTCKYFFVRKTVPICYRLQIKQGTSSFTEESLNLKFDSSGNDIYLKNTWITLSLFCKYFHNISNTFISTIIPRLYQCDAKYITIWNQQLTFDELKFLIGSENIVTLTLPNVRIRDENGEGITLENIMEFLPNIEHLHLSNVKVNKNTATILAKQNFNSKINTIKLLDIYGEPFDTTEFLNFCQKNRDEQFFLRMEFKPRQRAFIHEYITNFQKLMKDSFDFKTTHIEINYTPM